MKRIAILGTIILISACTQDEVFVSDYYQCQAEAIVNNYEHPKSEEFYKLMEEIVSSGVPGIMLTVHDKDGYWSSAYGLADLASGVEIQPCNITRVGSTVKMFTAVTMLLLQEQGMLNLDDPITKYLSDREIDGLKNAEKSTIRLLLKHSSGIFNYIQSAQFQTASLNDLIKVWHPHELLDYARGEEPYFEPGTDVKYSNTNYILLGNIIEKVTGKPFYEVFQQQIFIPQQLSFTHFAANAPVPEGIVRGYADLYSNLNLIQTTYYSGWDYFTADGGLISNAYDLNVFLTNLMDGKILSEASMGEMLEWQAPINQDNDEFQTHYGLGIFKIDTDFGPAYLHSGDAIGYFASMVYFPEQEVTIAWAVNANYGKVDQFTQTKDAMNRIFEIVLRG